MALGFYARRRSVMTVALPPGDIVPCLVHLLLLGDVCIAITVPREEPMVFVIIGRKDDWIGVSCGVEVLVPGVPDAD